MRRVLGAVRARQAPTWPLLVCALAAALLPPPVPASPVAASSSSDLCFTTSSTLEGQGQGGVAANIVGRRIC